MKVHANLIAVSILSALSRLSQMRMDSATYFHNEMKYNH